MWWPSGDGTGDVTSIPGSEGRPAASVSDGGGETTLTTKALRSAPLGAETEAEKTRWVESGSQAGDPRSPVVMVAEAAAPVRLRTRRLMAELSCRRYAIRLPAGAHATPLTAPASAASRYLARRPTS